MAIVVAGAVVGKALSLLVDQVLEKVKLLAEGDKRFRGLRSLLSRLQEPADYLATHEDRAGETIVRQWLQDLRKELAKAEGLVGIWPKIRRWNLHGKIKALNELIRITQSLERLDNSQTVIFASNVRNFGRLGEGVDGLGEGLASLGEGIDRLGGEVKKCVESLTLEVRSLTEDRRELAQATEFLLGGDQHASPEEIAEIKRKGLGISRSRANPHAESGPSRKRSFETMALVNDQEAFPDEVFGGDDVLDEVIAKILHENDYRKCIGLWNMGGAGKTFTAGRVFHDPRVQSYFGGAKRQKWVTVSRRSTYEVLKEIFVGLGGWEDDFPASDDVYSVRRALKRQLNLDKFLLVIDDVWEADQLDFIDLILEPKDFKRRVVLVTTRLKEILDKKHATTIEMSLLPEVDSWKLFSRNAFGRGQVPSELEGVAKFVAAECKRLPLALKVIGTTMAGETKLRMWENALQKLKHALILSKDHEVQVFGRLQLSVDNLRDRDESDSRLQHCFYYFAAFREDENIRPERLTSLWTAEGIVGKDPDSPISPESEAYELLGTLIALSMIEVEKKYDGAVKMHDVMRDLARFNLENTFGKGFSITERIPACQRLCLYRPGLQLTTFPKDWTVGQGQGTIATTSITLRAERLSFVFNALEELPERFDAPRLRVLLLGRNLTLKSISALFFERLKSLKILDLSNTKIKEIPEAVFDLSLLVLLNVSNCDNLREIPDSIKRLQNLQQLLMNDCPNLRTVPKSLTSLQSLNVLDAEDTFIWDGLNSSGHDESNSEHLESSPEDDGSNTMSADDDPACSSQDDDPACSSPDDDPACPSQDDDPACSSPDDDPACWSEDDDPTCLSQNDDHIGLSQGEISPGLRQDKLPTGSSQDKVPAGLSQDDGIESSSKDFGLGSSTKDVAFLQDVVLLESLQSLSASSNSSSPVAELGQLIGLQSLTLDCPHWEDLPEAFTDLVNLKSLTLHCSRVVVLPALDELQHLEKLRVSSDKLKNFPDSFGRGGAFPSLQTFITTCPLWKGPILQQGAMPRIKKFSIQEAQRMKLPASFRVLSSLSYLEVSSCQSLEDLSAFKEPNSFPHLKEISLEDSSFRMLPEGLLKSAPNLRRLGLQNVSAYPSVRNLPKDLREKKRLKQLEIVTGAHPE